MKKICRKSFNNNIGFGHQKYRQQKAGKDKPSFIKINVKCSSSCLGCLRSPPLQNKKRSMLMTNHEGNTDQNYHEMPLHKHQDSYCQKEAGVAEDVGKLETLHLAGGNAQWNSCCGRQLNGSRTHHEITATLQSHSSACIKGARRRAPSDVCTPAFTAALLPIIKKCRENLSVH